jgi:hypothetical protein
MKIKFKDISMVELSSIAGFYEFTLLNEDDEIDVEQFRSDCLKKI